MNRLILMAAATNFALWTSVVPQLSAREKAPQPIHDMTLCPVLQNTHAHMNERGKAGMGFSQTATGHHFLIQSGGGVIQVEAKNPRRHRRARQYPPS
ncbi:MAG: hypothetical protein ABLT11_02615, partial [Candidatus Acidiferrum sp.]